ncbi:hypothetical protein HJC23_011884 [Cyclotella cryptica]|uniref:Succinylglutamate desuccinylase/Aspartoacylase catalytic domain-containing protein n=1 Tax=Cyclotella cryptica TaxID=29204 RepID=A0ABD3QEK7_9STRA
MLQPSLTLTLALGGLYTSHSFQIISRATRQNIRSYITIVPRGPRQYNKPQLLLHMHSGPKRRSSIKKVDFSGLTDELTIRIARDLDLDKFVIKSGALGKSSIDKMTPQEAREVLANFVDSHPDAERQVARLVLKHLGINKSVFLSSRGSSLSIDRDAIPSSSTDLNQSFPLEHGEDIMPSLSPVPWLPDDSWASMSYDDKLGFMDHLTHGKFRSAITFGKGMDRVVLGNGPRRVLVLVGIHGNEQCGVEAVKIMLQRKALFTGDADVRSQDLDVNDNWKQPMDELFDRMTVEILLGNPQAVEMNTRFMKKNLNRLFDIHMLCNDASAEEEGYMYELQRAKLIAESIRCADIVLDIHSTSADVGSFALPSSMALSEQLAKCLPVKYVVESLAHMTLDGGTTLDCALLHDVPGICVECGQHSHPDVVSRAAAIISSFLIMQVSVEDGLQPCVKKTDRPIVMKCDNAERVQPGFEWLNQFPEFSFVPEYTPVFRTSERGDVLAPEGGAYIVMPTSSPVVGEEALFWASAK